MTRKFRYLVAGLFNTLVSYFLSIFLYYKLSLYLHLLVISFITYTLAIIISFTSYKFYVFKTRENFLIEFYRFVLVYGSITTLSIFCLWILVDFFHIKFWIAQGFIAFLGIFFSYFGNKEFAFNVKS